VVRHGEDLGAFYRASVGAERAEGRTTGGLGGLQWRSHFSSKGKRRGGETGSRGDEGVVATFHFAMGGEGVLHGGDEQVAAAFGREAVAWLKVEEDSGWARLAWAM
jgi:hypothetical protein